MTPYSKEVKARLKHQRASQSQLVKSQRVKNQRVKLLKLKPVMTLMLSQSLKSAAAVTVYALMNSPKDTPSAFASQLSAELYSSVLLH